MSEWWRTLAHSQKLSTARDTKLGSISYRCWILFTCVDILYMCGYSLHVWILFICVDTLYVCGYSLHVWILFTWLDLQLKDSLDQVA